LMYNRFLSYFLECDMDAFLWLVALSHLYCNCIPSDSDNIWNSLCEMVLATQIILFLAFWKVYCSFGFGTARSRKVTSKQFLTKFITHLFTLSITVTNNHSFSFYNKGFQ
jgi:hypothetical protein